MAPRQRTHHTDEEFDALLVWSAFRCNYCNRPVFSNAAKPRHRLTKDHIVPLCRGGVDLIENIAIACWRCNCLKGNKTATEFLNERPAFAQRVQKGPQRSTGIISLLHRVQFGEPFTMAELKQRIATAEATGALRNQWVVCWLTSMGVRLAMDAEAPPLRALQKKQQESVTAPPIEWRKIR